MPDATAILALVAGASGLVLTQVGTLVPSRKDFVSQLKLKTAACLEGLAASHCFLVKQSQVIGVEEFDNVMRGDGRTSRDYFSEHAQKTLDSNRDHAKLLCYATWFRACHVLLLVSIVALIVFGLSVGVFGHWVDHSAAITGMLLFFELASLVGLYVVGASAERIL